MKWVHQQSWTYLSLSLSLSLYISRERGYNKVQVIPSLYKYIQRRYNICLYIYKCGAQESQRALFFCLSLSFYIYVIHGCSIVPATTFLMVICRFQFWPHQSVCVCVAGGRWVGVNRVYLSSVAKRRSVWRTHTVAYNSSRSNLVFFLPVPID